MIKISHVKSHLFLLGIILLLLKFFLHFMLTLNCFSLSCSVFFSFLSQLLFFSETKLLKTGKECNREGNIEHYHHFVDAETEAQSG